MTKTVQIEKLIDALSNINEAIENVSEQGVGTKVEINKSGASPTGVASKITVDDTTYSIPSNPYGNDMMVLMGGLDREYGTQPTNYIGTFNTWVDVPHDGFKGYMSDYEEIILVCKRQATGIVGAKPVEYYRVPVLLETDPNLNITEHCFYQEGSSVYVLFGLDFAHNRFYLENFNYLCPIALIGYHKHI